MEAADMASSYNKLWKILIDKNMTKTKLRNEAKISVMDDIMEIIPDNNNSEKEGMWALWVVILIF